MASIDYLVKSRILCSFKMDVQSVSLLSEKSELLILLGQRWFIHDSLGSNWPRDPLILEDM